MWPRFTAIAGLWEFQPASHEYQIFPPLSTWSSMRFNTFMRLIWLNSSRQQLVEKRKVFMRVRICFAQKLIQSHCLDTIEPLMCLGIWTSFSVANSKCLKIKWEPFQTFNLFAHSNICDPGKTFHPKNNKTLLAKAVKRFHRFLPLVLQGFLEKQCWEHYEASHMRRHLTSCYTNLLTCGIFLCFLVEESQRQNFAFSN